MITTGFDARVKVQQIIENQLPEFILTENPKASEFLKQYYISQEFQGGSIDLAENLDQYLNLNNFNVDVISGSYTLTSDITDTDSTIYVDNTKGFPPQYGLFKIDNEIITYTGLTANSFTGCIRGFSGIVNYHKSINPEELEFSTSNSSSHANGTSIQNLSALFLKEIYKKLKQTLAPGFEDVDFVEELDVNNFIKQIKSFYQAKGTEESFRILYNVLYGIDPTILNLEDFLLKPSSAEFIRREVIVADLISGSDPNKLVGQVIRNSDNTASAPVSEVEIIRRGSKNYYKIQLFAGFNDKSLIEGNFEITSKTKVIDTVEVNDTVISVDSTIGFDNSGTLVCGSNTITYSDKSINQFFGCSGVLSQILPGSDIRSDKIIYGYEDGDLSKKVELRITGVLSELDNQNDIYFRSVNDVISIKNIGDKIENPPINPSYKQFVFNSWIYNTSSRYEVESFANNQLVLHETPDKSSLKVGDSVNILYRNSESSIVDNCIVTAILNRPDQSTPRVVYLNKNIVGISSSTRLSLRKNINYAKSSSVALKYPKIISEVQNTYNEDNKFIHIASNSLPNYNITQSVVSKTLSITSSSNLNNIFSGSRLTEEGITKYSILSFDTEVNFITGDAIVYTSSGSAIPGLVENQTYYVEVVSPVNPTDLKNKIRLYNARSFITTQNYIEFELSSEIADHTFTLESQKGTKKLSPKKILRKISLNQNIQSGLGSVTQPGPIGLLINGVEIINYKSNDKIYYGPISNIRIINSGKEYDLIDPPTISVSSPSVSTGTTCLIQPVIRGNLKQVIVDPNEVNVSRVLSATLTGGNGSGAVLEPILQNQFREIDFNAQLSTLGGGVDVSNETITFIDFHLLQNGVPIVYNNNGNSSLGIGTYQASNTDQGRYLTNGSIYYPEIVNTRSIKLYNSLSDLNSGINTVGFTTANVGGIHKFRLLEGKNILSAIKVINGGEGYENRSLHVKPSGISTFFSTVTFDNHGFNDGDLINYKTEVGFGYSTSTPISGLSTSNQYYIIKIDNSSFRVAYAGNINTTPIKSDFNRGKYVQFNSVGVGKQIFEYPKINLNLEIEYEDSVGIITATPVVRGSIVDAYVYEPGTDYGSEILNFHKRPVITVRNGSSAQLKPIIIRGAIVGVEVQNSGSYYTSSPDLIVNGDGLGANLRAVVSNGRIVDVIIISSGANYSPEKTSIRVDSVGKNAVFEVDVRELTINSKKRFSEEVFLEDVENDENLFYGVVGYSTDREGVEFLDPNNATGHSKVIGWAYDGNPIYGPYGYSDPNDNNSTISLVKSGYTSNLSNIYNRPNNFDLGFFVEDYKFTDSGNLDISNGRFSKTPEFPNGIYAYYVGVTTDLQTNKLVSEFPYFIGQRYRSNVEVDVNEDQDYDFNNSNLIRNTFPYRVNQTYSNNDFIVESNKIYKQTANVESISSGNVESLTIINSGNNYAVGDLVVFDNAKTNGSGASAEVKSIFGKDIVSLQTTSEVFENSLVTRKTENIVEIKVNPYHTFLNGETVQISGITTDALGSLIKSHKVGVSSDYSSLIYEVPSNLTVGVVTDIYISPFPSNISVGSTIGIGTEVLSVLNIYGNQNVLRVQRGVSGSAHTATSRVNIYPNTFSINAKTDYFSSQDNEIIYFNPTKFIGVGTISGNSVTTEYYVGTELKSVSIETQNIYLPNHSFNTNQRVLLSKPTGSSSLLVRNTPTSSNFSILDGVDSEYFYVINKSKDFIGIVTEVGLTTTTNGLYFMSSGTDNDLYSIQSTFPQIFANVSKITSQVSVSTSHNLAYGDNINLIVKPSLSVGLDTSSSILVKYNSSFDKLLVNPIGFTSTGINTSTNRIYIPSHKLTTGQKVFYDSLDFVSSGLTTGGYFVYRIDNNHIQLCNTYEDILSNPPNVVSIGSSGGSLQELSLINPQLKITKNNNIVFNLSSTTLSGYNFKIFFDKNQNNEFVSIGNTSSFLISKTGTIGVTTNAKLTVGFNTSIPTKLYYNLEKSGNLVSIDTEVKNNSEILYVDSVYNNQYQVFGVGSTTFSINLTSVPEKDSYTQNECSTLEYTTDSRRPKGSVNELNLISGGVNYEKIPYVVGITTLSSGVNAVIKANSTNIGKIKQLRIVSEGFEYASDKTLKPQADIPRLVRLQSSEKINNVQVSFGGRNLLSPPSLSLVNVFTNQKINRGLFIPKLSGSSIVSVDIIDEPKGLDSTEHVIFTENNSNGVTVERILSYTGGVVTCELSTPSIDGFSTPPFEIGDQIFVEGLQKQTFVSDIGVVTSPGTGFNSADNGYQFFTVVNYINSNPAILSYNIGEYTSNAGTPVTIQTSFNSIVNKKNYPTFILTQVPSIFFIGESLLVNGNPTDLVVENAIDDYITVVGDYILNYDDLLSGSKSGNLAKVNEDLILKGQFSVDYSNKKNYGWKNDIGKLNNSYQVLPDNDYYQSLSYSIKTSGEKYKDNKVIEYSKIRDSVNRLVHPIGLKNFADVGITSSALVGIGSDQKLNQTLDFIEESRVDTFNNFDLALDLDPTATSSDAILFRSKKLSDYIECISNRVLQIDDISGQFSSQEFNRDSFVEAYEYSITDYFSKFLVQVSDEDKDYIQTSELVVLNNFDNTYTLNKVDLYTGDDLLGDFSGDFADNGNPVLRFNPIDPLEKSYNIKIYRDYFSDSPTNLGIGYTDIGFLRLNARIENLSANNGITTTGITTDIFRSQLSSIDSIYSNVLIINNATLDMNYFEILAYHDGSDGYINEYYFDSENNLSGSSFGFIGTFGTSLDSGIFKLNFTNNTNNSVTIKSKTVGFGTTSSGIGTFRYLVNDQAPGFEKSARLESSYQVSVGTTAITTYQLSVESTLKSLIRVAVGSTVSLHQILVVSDQQSVNIQSYPFLSVGTASTSGIGTFGASVEGTDVVVKFYPDVQFASDNLLIQKFNQFIYFDVDEVNIPEPLNYGVGLERIDTSFYGSLNNFGKDRLSFDLNYESTPIFEKSFNPKNSAILNTGTGVFTIPNHFFQTGEELIYTPDSTLAEDVSVSVGIGTTLVGGKTFKGDFIVGFSTITGVGSTIGISPGELIVGDFVPSGTTILSIGSTYTNFIGNVISTGSTVITGIANTTVLTVGSGIFSGDSTSLGTIIAIGINSITASTSIVGGNDRVYYSDNLNSSLTLSQVSTASTIRGTYVTGIVTDICPSTVYAIRLDNDNFKISGTSGGSGIGFTFTSVGVGNAHRLEMSKKTEKSLITVNGVNQYPLIWTPTYHTLQYNGGSVGSGITFVALSGISSIFPRDLIKVDNEFLGVINVGFGTTNIGPVSGLGTIPIVQVYRGFVGSSATTHVDGSIARIYRGSYNIVRNKIHFTEAPDGKGNNNRLDSSGLALPKSSFNGRVFLRRDYEFNKIYDDISNEFTGIGRTFILKKDGENTSGIEPGSGLVFINDVFQTPDTENNEGNNYTLDSSIISGITTLTFTAVTRPNTDDVIIVPSDVNQNQVPRGGIIISLGSTGGLGYAPLVGASVTAVIGAGGSITAVGVGTTDINGSGYRGSVSIGITDSTGVGATISAIVGAGGSLSFLVINGGSGYTNPSFKIDSPSYQNLSIEGISRLSIGDTTQTGIGLSLTINVGESSVTGIGTSYFEVKSYVVTKPGYAFERGDKFKVVGLVTDSRLASPIEELIFTVEEIFTDSFACIQLGELDYIDNIKSRQNGTRTRFPLFRNNQLLSFEKDRTNPESALIDFDSVLVIYLNGVLQEPGVSYTFEGGTTFRFTEAPKPEDNIAIFFYRGTRDIDSSLVNVYETVKSGDTLQIIKNNQIQNTVSQDGRIVTLIRGADTVDTGIYLGDGIDSVNYKPINWSKQKRDLIINDNIEFKSRDSLETFVVPNARVIKNISINDDEIFVDSAQLFNYEENESVINIQDFEGLIVDTREFTSATLSPVVSASSTISSITIVDGGLGYAPNSTISLSIAKPIGIGTTAVVTANISSSGIITSINIINPGFGYTNTTPPSILSPQPSYVGESLSEIRFVEGFAGIITGISTCPGTGSNPLAIKFDLLYDSTSNINSLSQGYPILITETNVGNGVTSIDSSDSAIVGIGTTYLDNIYIINEITRNNLVGIITCNVLSTSNIIGLSTTGDFCGRFSWGRLSGLSRSSNPVSIAVSGYTVSSGLSTFPQIVRRGYGLRSTGALIKVLPVTT